MINKKITCDFCGKETTEAYYAMAAKIRGYVKDTGEICPECWETAKTAINNCKSIKVMTAKDFKDEVIQ